MSAVPRYPNELGHAGLRLTAAQFFDLGQSAERYELVDGVVVMSPRPTPLHQAALLLVLNQLKQYTDANPGAHVFPEVDWKLSDHRVYAPDIVCYAPGRLNGVPERLTQTPDLVIEILSPSTRALDLSTKRADYAHAGLPEYWAIDPATAAAHCFRNDGQQLAEHQCEGDTLASAILENLRVNLVPLREITRES
jgi:Uma2 family endonuclease